MFRVFKNDGIALLIVSTGSFFMLPIVLGEKQSALEALFIFIWCADVNCNILKSNTATHKIQHWSHGVNPIQIKWNLIIILDPNTEKIQKNAHLLWHRQHDTKFWGNPLLQATKRRLNNSETVKKNEKLYDASNFSFWLLLCSVLSWRMITQMNLSTYLRQMAPKGVSIAFIVADHKG